MGTGGSFSGDEEDVKLTTYLQLVPRSRKRASLFKNKDKFTLLLSVFIKQIA
jgi:hypothetical protein